MNKKAVYYYIMSFIVFNVIVIAVFLSLRETLSLRGAWFFYYFPIAMLSLVVLLLSNPLKNIWLP